MFWVAQGLQGGEKEGSWLFGDLGWPLFPASQLGSRSWDMGGNKTKAQEALALAPLRQPLYTNTLPQLPRHAQGEMGTSITG